MKRENGELPFIGKGRTKKLKHYLVALEEQELEQEIESEINGEEIQLDPLDSRISEENI